MSDATLTSSPRRGITRRGFLITGGIALGGGMAALYFGRGPLRRAAAGFISTMDLPSGISNFTPDFWLSIQDDNTILLRSPKVEMGQDIFTGFAMLVAEELDVLPESIEVRPGESTDSAKDGSGTGGSSTTASLYVPLRQVAATLRETLKQAAAGLWNVPVGQISTAEGHLTAGDRRMSYAEIHAATPSWELAETPDLRPTSTFRYIGKERSRVDLLPKVMGHPIYGIDAELPNMAYAAVLYCPYIGGSLDTLDTLDTSEAEAFPGVLQVLQEPDLVAVVAESRYAAEMGKRRLKAAWTVPKRWQQDDIEKHVTVGGDGAVSVQRQGDVDEHLDDGPNVLRAEYRTPLAAHAHMEPNGVVAQVDDEQALIITGTQFSDGVRQQVAEAVGLKKNQVNVRNTFLGGGFGRRYFRNNASEAARIARAIGRPVHVFKDREDEFRNGYLRPNAHHVYRAKLDDNGSLVAIEHQLASGDMILENGPFASVQWLFGADWISAGHGLHIPYDAEHKSAEMWHKSMPFQTGIWRGVGMVTNTFASECFIDELAAHTQTDPLEFRLAHLSSQETIIQRLRNVLELAAEASGWNNPRTPDVGWGIACAEDRKTVVAAVAQVTVDEGQIRVRHITQAIDPGVIIHPEGVRNQVEGAIMMGLSTALFEEVRVEDGQLHATNFHQYPVATLADTPTIEVVLHAGADKPSGVGEPPIAPVAPAIANAVFDLTGQRLRDLPLRL